MRLLRVLATVEAPLSPGSGFAPAPEDQSALAADLRELLTRVADGLAVRCRVDITEDEETVTGTFAGDDLGLLIGRHGQTIDAIQYLASAVVYRKYGDDRKGVVVDASGYRARRRETLEALAVRSAEHAKSTGEPVELEPMSSVERRIVHVRLQDEPGVSTRSGASPTATSSSTRIDAGSSGCSRPRSDRDRDLPRRAGSISTRAGPVRSSSGTRARSWTSAREAAHRDPDRRRCPTATLSCSGDRQVRLPQSIAADFPNVRVVCGRAEEQPVDSFGVAIAKALAPPPVAVNGAFRWYVRAGRRSSGRPVADADAVERGAAGGRGRPTHRCVVPKVEPTPPGFPRRIGIARKRPLA
jgi:spoIIIJ-associated protein